MKDFIGRVLKATGFLAPSAASTAIQSSEWRAWKFAGGKAKVLLPPKFTVDERGNGVIEAHTEGTNGELHLFFELHQAPNASGMKDAAEGFVRASAKKKNLEVREIPGKVFIMESGRESVVHGAPVRTMHWQVGFGNNLLVMTLSAPDSDKDSPNVKDFFETEMERILGGLSVNGA